MATVKAEALRAKTPDELKTQLVELKKEQFNLRFQTAGGQVENPSRARVVRREIARIKTVLGQQASAAKSGKQLMTERTMQGTVVSDKADKTVTVNVERRIMHPVYKKIITQSKKFAAHDAENRFKEGDSVRIRECAPVSKSKTFEVVYDDVVKG